MTFKIIPAKLFQYYLPVTLTLFMLVTVKRTVVSEDGGFETLYGLPFAYITDNAFCSGCYLVFYPALIVDVAIYFAIVWLVFYGIERLGLKFKTHWLPMSIAILISCFWIWFFCIITEDSHFQFKNDWPYKTTHSERVFDQMP